jgi:hypothetical protein
VSEKRTFWVVLALSLTVHGLFLWWAKTERPPIVRDERAAIEMSFVETKVESEVKKVEVAEPKPEDKKLKKLKKIMVAESAPSGPPETKQANLSDVPSNGGSEPMDAPVGAESSEKISLIPSSSFSQQLGTGVPTQFARGETVRNSADEVPNDDYAQFKADKAGQKMNAQLQDFVGLAVHSNGGGPKHFRDLEGRIRGMLSKEKVAMTPLTASQQVEDLAGTIFGGPISAEGAKAITDSPLGRSITNNSVMSPDVDSQRFREAGLQSLSASAALQERASRVRLRTVIEFTSDASGGLADGKIIEKSGDQVFDESVLHLGRKAVRTMNDADDKGLSTDWWLSRWQFTFEPPRVKVKLLMTRKIEAPR